MRGNGIKQPLCHLVGICIQEPNPLLLRRGNRCQPLEQERKPIAEAEILAIAGSVLTDQVDFAYSLLEQSGCFGNHRFEPAAAKLAAVLRDHAKSARMIATLGDL